MIGIATTTLQRRVLTEDTHVHLSQQFFDCVQILRWTAIILNIPAELHYTLHIIV